MNTAEQFIQLRLQERIEKDMLRKLSDYKFPIDFCSNDYLGFARSVTLAEAIHTESAQLTPANGSGGSRLLSGNNAYTEATEQLIADFHQAAAGLIFNSGYDANTGLISALAQRGDTIISDELIHASLIDGARLSHATRYTFRHNDPDALEAKLKLASGRIYVLIESVYSMDGDLAPLPEINAICQRYGANLIVDEAHATGVFGKYGVGRVQESGLEKEVFARIVTFGKALGTHGAIVLGSAALRAYLINFSRSFIYTTAAPLHQVISIRCAYQLLQKQEQPALLFERIQHYLNSIQKSGLEGTFSQSPIQTIHYHSNSKARAAAASLQQQGMDVRAILSPTVPRGTERIRICLHTYNTTAEIDLLVQQLNLLKHHD